MDISNLKPSHRNFGFENPMHSWFLTFTTMPRPQKIIGFPVKHHHRHGWVVGASLFSLIGMMVRSQGIIWNYPSIDLFHLSIVIYYRIYPEWWRYQPSIENGSDHHSWKVVITTIYHDWVSLVFPGPFPKPAAPAASRIRPSPAVFQPWTLSWWQRRDGHGDRNGSEPSTKRDWMGFNRIEWDYL